MSVSIVGIYRIFLRGGPYAGLSRASLTWLHRAHLDAALNDTHRPDGLTAIEADKWHHERADEIEALLGAQQEIAA